MVFFLGKSFVSKETVTNETIIRDTITIEKTIPLKEIKEKFASLSVSQNNFIYLGVENPIRVNGIHLKNTVLSSEGGNVKKVGDRFVISAARPGMVKVILKDEDYTITQSFEAKPIPDPVAKIGSSTGGAIGNGEFKAQVGVGNFLNDFPFTDTRCQIMGYTLTYTARTKYPVSSINYGSRFNAKSKRLVFLAKPGNTYHFTNVKCKCPGDSSARTLNSMVFEIQ